MFFLILHWKCFIWVLLGRSFEKNQSFQNVMLLVKHKKTLKSDSHIPKKNCVIYFIESPLKMMKNAFYFILKALFVLKIFELLSWLFGHLGKTAWLERQG